MLNRIDELFAKQQNFAFETTLETKSYKQKMIAAQKKGYHVTLVFFWLNKVELAVERVKARVAEGGHNINEDVIVRRYWNGLKNLFEIFIPLVDKVYIYDNSDGKPLQIAEKTKGNNFLIFENMIYQNLIEKYEHQ